MKDTVEPSMTGLNYIVKLNDLLLSSSNIFRNYFNLYEELIKNPFYINLQAIAIF
jgi:hypothetical protein